MGRRGRRSVSSTVGVAFLQSASLTESVKNRPKTEAMLETEDLARTRTGLTRRVMCHVNWNTINVLRIRVPRHSSVSPLHLGMHSFRLINGFRHFLPTSKLREIVDAAIAVGTYGVKWQVPSTSNSRGSWLYLGSSRSR